MALSCRALPDVTGERCVAPRDPLLPEPVVRCGRSRLLFALGYTDDLAAEVEIAAAVAVARGDPSGEAA